MGHANGIITSPVNTDDVREVLGENTHDVKTLCMSNKINPWSKHKPIRGFSYRGIAESDFEGTAADKTAGIIYGLMAATPVNSLKGIHGCDFSYAGKPGTDDWGRLTDFIGYSHSSLPLPVGSVSEWIHFDIDKYVPVLLSFAGGIGGTGKPSDLRTVSVDGIINAANGGLSSARLSAYYPCACLTVNGKEYLRALALGPNQDVSPDTPTPELPVPGDTGGERVTSDGTDSGAWRTSWWINLDGLDDAADITFKDGLTLDVSVCFLPAVKNTVYGIDFTKWRQLSGSVMYPTIRAYGCPGAMGRKLELRRYYQPGLECFGLAVSGKNIMIGVRNATKWSAATYTVTIYLYPPKTGTDTPLFASNSVTRKFDTAGERDPLTVPGLDLSAELVTLAQSFDGNYQKGVWTAQWYVKIGSVTTNSGAEMLDIGNTVTPDRPIVT